MERESGFYPQFESAEVRESQEPSAAAEIETEQQGVIRKLNTFLKRHPALRTVVYSLNLAASIVSVEKINEMYHEPPAIAHRDPEIGDISEHSVDLMKRLNEEVGSLKFVLSAQSVASSAERAEMVEKPRPTIIQGFEKFKISNETIKGIVEQTLPRGFTRNISSMTYRDYDRSLGQKYGFELMQQSSEAAHATALNRRIEFVRGALEEEKEEITNHILIHEVFHLQDWTTNSLLTLTERLELFQSVIDRVKASDRFKSGYVENIRNDDKQKELDVKAEEYFAEIGAAYLSDNYTILPYADRELIGDFIKKIDPHFDREKALKQRKKLIADKPRPFIMPSLEEMKANFAKSLERFFIDNKQLLHQRIADRNPNWSDKDVDNELEKWHAKEKKSALEQAEKQYHDLLEQNKKAKAQQEEENK